MNNLIKGLTSNDSFTENGMVTNSTSSNNLVDLFFTIGAMRSAERERIVSNFIRAYEENPTLAMKMLFYARDIRGGQGERRVFRIIAEAMLKRGGKYKSSLLKNLKYVPEYGRWDDLIFLFNSNKAAGIRTKISKIIKSALKEKNGLCAKWLPREKKQTKQLTSDLRKALGYDAKTYRQTISELSNTVEQQMCSKKWEAINFNHVPSVAMNRYKNAFVRNINEKYNKWLEDLKEGKEDVKVNASTLYPYDIVSSLNKSNSGWNFKLDDTNIDLANEQWKNLPNYAPDDSNLRIMPVIDLSGSMFSPLSTKGGALCIDVSVSLGCYISERISGPFKNHVMSFSDKPLFIQLPELLSDKVIKILSNEKYVGYSTNLESVYDKLLSTAHSTNAKEDEMPTHILMISDMEFNSCVHKNQNSFEMIRNKYEKAGYKMPNLVFWNVQSRHEGNYPVKFDEAGVALVSGCSPSILKAVCSGDIYSPMQIVLNILDTKRYSNISA